MALTAHKVRATATPTYLSNLVHTCAPAWALRSSDARQMVVPRTNTDLALAQHAFSVAAPSIWNALPAKRLTVPQHCYIQTTPKDTSVYLELVTPHCQLCIFGLHGTLQILLLLLLILLLSSL